MTGPCPDPRKGTKPMNDTPEPTQPERCDELRTVGQWELFCELDAGHDGWHHASLTDTRIIATDGFRSETASTETVSWEPHSIKRRLTAAMRRSHAVPVAAAGGDTTGSTNG